MTACPPVKIGSKRKHNAPVTFDACDRWPAGSYTFNPTPNTPTGAPFTTVVEIQEHVNRFLSLPTYYLVNVSEAISGNGPLQRASATKTPVQKQEAKEPDGVTDAMKEVLNDLATAKQDDVIQAAEENHDNPVFLQALLAAELKRPEVGRTTRPKVVDAINAFLEAVGSA